MAFFVQFRCFLVRKRRYFARYTWLFCNVT